MMRRCCVASCFSWSDETPDILFHEFPHPTSNLYTIWNQKLLPIWEAGQEPVVCSLHFTEADYELDQAGEKFVLRNTAIPSENLTQLDRPEVTTGTGKPEAIVKCRLCAKPRNLSDTMDLRSRMFPVDVFQFLTTFLEFENSEDGRTTKVICRVCASKLDDVLAFKMSCSNAFLLLNQDKNPPLALVKEDAYDLIANDSIIDEDVLDDNESSEFVADPEDEPTWRCLACTTFTGPRSVVQQHSVECKEYYNQFVRKQSCTKKKFKNPIISSKENAPKYLNRKYMCRFNTELQKEFPFLRLIDASDETLLCCRICSKKFSIAYKGRGSIRYHIASRVHAKGEERLKKLMKVLGHKTLEEALESNHEQYEIIGDVVEDEEYEVEILTGKSDVDEILVNKEGDHIVFERMADVKDRMEVADSITDSYE